MQAIITKYFPATNTKPARIKAGCARGSMFISVHSEKMIANRENDEKNHIIAAYELQRKFINEDEKRYAVGMSAWGKMGMISGSLTNGDYVHVQAP